MTAMSGACRYRASCAASLMVVRELLRSSTPTTTVAGSSSVVMTPPSRAARTPHRPRVQVAAQAWHGREPASDAVSGCVMSSRLCRGLRKELDCPGWPGPNAGLPIRPGCFAGDLQDRSTGVSTSFRPHVLREYALIADGERGALIGPDGAIAWLCAPRWDSPATFSGLFGGCGTYGVTPA